MSKVTTSDLKSLQEILRTEFLAVSDGGCEDDIEYVESLTRLRAWLREGVASRMAGDEVRRLIAEGALAPESAGRVRRQFAANFRRQLATEED